MEYDSEKVLAEAKAEAEVWVENFHLHGKWDPVVVLKHLQEAWPEDQCFVFLTPKEASEFIQKEFQCTDPELCIWDYYLMAFFECACGVLGENEPEFTRHSMLPAFSAGLGFLINLGSVKVGVCLPEAHQDDQRRTHCEDGPAIRWGVDRYFWHGVEVEEDWILQKDQLTPDMFLQESNVERRRVLAEIMGWGKIMDQLGFKMIHEDHFGQLLRVEESLDDPEFSHALFVKFTCPSTGREYVHRVPPTVTTAHEAVASMWGKTVDEYAPQQES